VRLPLQLGAGERRVAHVEVPPPAEIPAGFVYVPAGAFLYGSADDEDVRQGFMRTQPLRELHTGPFLIARHEVTFAEYLAFLDELPAAERERRRPDATGRSHRLALRHQGGAWHFELEAIGLHLYRARAGEMVRYRARNRRLAVQDWSRFPVAGISYADGVAFASWLARRGRVPGARLCTEHEWERAARGADGRRFPWGGRAEPDDMNHDRTYGQQPLAFGPDEVGAHPAGRSPFGLDDMAGNVWELTRSIAEDGEAVSRGGSWYLSEIGSRSANREPIDANMRLPDNGLRLCATPPGRPRQAGTDVPATAGRN
jgi:formylglycine-generating enzyme required for sulfatase activity